MLHPKLSPPSQSRKSSQKVWRARASAERVQKSVSTDLSCSKPYPKAIVIPNFQDLHLSAMELSMQRIDFASGPELYARWLACAHTLQRTVRQGT